MPENYPTEWFGGKSRGSIKEYPEENSKSYIVTMSPPEGKQIYKLFRNRNR